MEYDMIHDFALGYTNGFRDAALLLRHYQKRRAMLGVGSIPDYATLADEFLGAKKDARVQECPRSRGDVVRFDPVTDMSGVVDPNNVIRTFYRIVPCASVSDLAIRLDLRRAGLCHGYATKQLYFDAECKKW